jgi:hypothetical protein
MQEIKRGRKIAQEVARKYKRRQDQFRKWKIAQCTRSDKKDKKIAVMYLSLKCMVL